MQYNATIKRKKRLLHRQLWSNFQDLILSDKRKPGYHLFNRSYEYLPVQFQKRIRGQSVNLVKCLSVKERRQWLRDQQQRLDFSEYICFADVFSAIQIFYNYKIKLYKNEIPAIPQIQKENQIYHVFSCWPNYQRKIQ